MAPASGIDIETRPGTPADLACVYATWLRSYRHSSRFAKRIGSNAFFADHHLVIERLFARGATLVIAHPSGDPGTIVGYLVAEKVRPGTRVNGVEVPPDVLHFVYVKGPFRRMGIGTALVKAAGIDLSSCVFTHLTHDAELLWDRVMPRAQHRPHLAF